jgi:PEP-CTERM motif
VKTTLGEVVEQHRVLRLLREEPFVLGNRLGLPPGAHISAGQHEALGGFKQIDVCVFAANNCSGGTINDGIQSRGHLDTFTVDIKGVFGATPKVTLSTFAVKFQTQTGSFEFPGGSTTGGGGGGGPSVPEPGSLVLLGAALLLLTYARVRSRPLAQPVEAAA